MSYDKTHARKLRRQQTNAERILWFALRDRRFLGLKFRRQYSIPPYVVDFLCWKKQCIIELDGGQHVEKKDYDNARSHYLEKKGFRVIRFWNNEVICNLDGVLEHLTLTLSSKERE